MISSISLPSCRLYSNLDDALSGCHQEDGSIVISAGGLVQQLEASWAGAGVSGWVRGGKA